MNLLKVLVLIFCAASLAVLLPNKAAAVDHPWDDRSLDSSHVTGEQINNGLKPPKPYSDDSIIHKVFDWTRQWLWEVSGISWGVTKDQPKGTVVDNNTKRPVNPVVPRKNK
jgi:hypothetical protein